MQVEKEEAEEERDIPACLDSHVNVIHTHTITRKHAYRYICKCDEELWRQFYDPAYHWSIVNMTLELPYTTQAFTKDLQKKFSASVGKVVDVKLWVGVKIFSITEMQLTAGINVAFLLHVPGSRNRTAVDEKAELIRASLNVRIPFSFSERFLLVLHQ
jgi:hypothetical protein